MHLPVRRSGKADEEPCGAVWSSVNCLLLLAAACSLGASVATGLHIRGKAAGQASTRLLIAQLEQRIRGSHMLMSSWHEMSGILRGLQVFVSLDLLARPACELFAPQGRRCAVKARHGPGFTGLSQSGRQWPFFCQGASCLQKEGSVMICSGEDLHVRTRAAERIQASSD